MVRMDKLGGWDGHVHTAMFKTDNQQGPTVQRRELCPMFCNNPNGKRVFYKEQMYVYV